MLRLKSPCSQGSANPNRSGIWVELTCSQKARSLSSRSFGALPAIKAALIAPTDIPETQSGCKFASASA
jgi:hypothetical protein